LGNLFWRHHFIQKGKTMSEKEYEPKKERRKEKSGVNLSTPRPENQGSPFDKLKAPSRAEGLEVHPEPNSATPPSKAELRGAERVKVSRRDFLKGMGTSAVAASLTTTSLALPPGAEAALPPGVKEAIIQLTVNEKVVRVKVKSHWTLLDVLRKELGLTGTRRFCDRGSCGACTVIMEGKAIYACSRLAIEADGKSITTIEGLADGEKLHPIQEAFVQNDGMQCGFCTSGQILSVKALLDVSPRPTMAQMKEALSGNICRCSAYPKILKSAMAAAERG
jgi:xanthine dehydrogenase YagT iron-sulfur-binding subunit